MRTPRYWLVGLAISGLLLLAGSAAAALNLDLQDGPIPPPTPSVPDPTERDSRMKEADAARPTPTAVPSVLTCPATEEVCDFGLELVDALGTGGASILAVASPVPIQCPADGSVVALQPFAGKVRDGPGEAAAGERDDEGEGCQHHRPDREGDDPAAG